MATHLALSAVSVRRNIAVNDLWSPIKTSDEEQSDGVKNLSMRTFPVQRSMVRQYHFPLIYPRVWACKGVILNSNSGKHESKMHKKYMANVGIEPKTFA
jgi:hypothetical protein